MSPTPDWPTPADLDLEGLGLVVDHGDLAGDDLAVFDTDRAYRYALVRRWSRPGPLLVWLMLNPSTADAFVLDPTLRRCRSFTQAWGYGFHGGMLILNLFALRSTDPDALLHHPDPVGPANDAVLSSVLAADRKVVSGLVIAGWGAHPIAVSRAPRVVEAVTAAGWRLGAAGTTKLGAPRHPLYLRGDVVPTDYALP